MIIPKKYLTETIILVENSHMIEPDHIFQILTQDKTASVKRAATDPITQYYKKLADEAGSGRIQGQHGQKSLIVLDKFKLSKRAEAANLGFKGPRYNSLGTALKELKKFMDGQGGYDPKSDKSNVIQITTLELLAQVLKMPVPKVEDPDDEKYPEGKIDWTAYRAKKLADDGKAGKPTSKSLEEFYEIYYRKEYAGFKSKKEQDQNKEAIVEKLKSLNKLLIPEFNKLGYNPEANPFAQFLKLLIEHDIEIFKKLTLNNYGALHNSFIDKNITGNKLGNFDNKNILFCRNLYDYKGSDIVNYLSLYKQTIDRAKEENSKYADNPELLVSKIFIQQKRLSDDFAENVKQLLELDENQVVLPGKDKEAKMRSYLEISELYSYLFKATVKQKINKPIADKLCEKAKEAGVIEAMFNYLLNKDKLSETKQQKYSDWFKKLEYKPGEKILKQSTIKCEKILADFIVDTSAVDMLLFRLKNLIIDANNGNGTQKDEKKS